MDAKLLIILASSLISACSTLPSDKVDNTLPVAENAMIPGIFMPTDILKLFQKEAQTTKENKQVKDTKEIKKPYNHVVNVQSSDQTSTALKPGEVVQSGAHKEHQDSVVEQTPISQSKPPQLHKPNLHNNLNSESNHIPNDLPEQEVADTEQSNNHPPNLYYILPNYNSHATGYYDPSYQPQTVYISYPLTGYYKPQNVVNQQPYIYIAEPTYSPQPKIYNQHPNIYSQQPIVYNQQPNIYTQQPNVFNQQPNVYDQQPAQYIQRPPVHNQPLVVYSQEPNVYNTQPVLIRPMEANQQVHKPIGQKKPNLNSKPNNGVMMNPNSDQVQLYAIVPMKSNQNSIPNNNAYLTHVQQVPLKSAILLSTKDEEN